MSYTDLMQMSTNDLILEIVNEHAAWLYSKGYEEKSLHSYIRQGNFLEVLKRLLGSSIQQSNQAKEKIQFEIPITGFFNNDRDFVFYKFQYEYNPELQKLMLTDLSAILNGTVKNFKIKDNNQEELPAATKVYKTLSNERQTKTLRSIEEMDEKIKLLNQKHL